MLVFSVITLVYNLYNKICFFQLFSFLWQLHFFIKKIQLLKHFFIGIMKLLHCVPIEKFILSTSAYLNKNFLLHLEYVHFLKTKISKKIWKWFSFCPTLNSFNDFSFNSFSVYSLALKKTKFPFSNDLENISMNLVIHSIIDYCLGNSNKCEKYSWLQVNTIGVYKVLKLVSVCYFCGLG